MNTSPDTPDFACAHAVLSIDAAKQFEAALFCGDETREWAAMCRAGRAVGEGVLRDFREIGEFPAQARVLVLVGKGHNGGDALLAAKYILEKYPQARVSVCFVFGERALRPLAARAWREISGSVGVLPAVAGERGAGFQPVDGQDGRPPFAGKMPARPECPERTGFCGFDVCIDGIFGFQFRPPVDERVAALIESVNAAPIRLRAAVDLPSGLGGDAAGAVFRADFTYATGIVKTPVLAEGAGEKCGRVRYLDLGFWGSGGMGDSPMGLENSARNTGGSPVAPEPHGRVAHATRTSILTPSVLAPLRALRPAQSDKRDYGHLFIVGGSRKYPGAVLMSVMAALSSSAGLVTAFVPESLASTFSAQVPEAIWCGMPESPEGGLALEGFAILRQRLQENASSTSAATALVIGPGLSRDREAHTLVADVVKMVENIPVVLDADALQPEIVAMGKAPRVLTPHAGEFQRIKDAVPTGAVVVRKGPVTRIERGAEKFVSLFGGPVLARGGSGDLLAGMIGGLLAQRPKEPLMAACRGVVWHGMAADYLARAHGQQAVRVTQLLDYLSEALREESTR